MRTVLNPMKVLAAAAVSFVSAFGATAFAQAPEWAVDMERSALSFTAYQSGDPVEGSFREFDADIRFDPADVSAGSVEVTIRMPSATTSSDSRDETMKSSDLLAVEEFPTATFVAGRFEKGEGENAYVAPGELTLRGVTKAVDLPFTLEIDGEGPGATASAEGTITIQRLDFGVGKGDWKDTGTVENRVDIGIRIVATRQ